MKKITILLAAIGLATSSMAFSAEQLVRVDDIYAKMKNGSERAFFDLDEACDALAGENDPFGTFISAKFYNYYRPVTDGDKEAKLACLVKERNNGGVIEKPVSWYGPIYCKNGGLYPPFHHGCFDYVDMK